MTDTESNDEKVNCNYLWDVVVSSFSLLLLQLDGNTSDWRILNTSHQMSNETSNLVSQLL